MSTLNELAAKIHETSQTKGFWNGSTCMNKYCQAKTPRHPADAILLISSECTEAYEAIRDGYALDDDATDWISGPNTPSMSITEYQGKPYLTARDGKEIVPPWPMTPELYAELGFEGKPVGVPSELADILIRTLDTAAAWGIDLDAAVARKLAYNQTRPHMHGRKA